MIVCAYCGQDELGRVVCFRCGAHPAIATVTIAADHQVTVCLPCAAGDRTRPSVSHSICATCDALYFPSKE